MKIAMLAQAYTPMLSGSAVFIRRLAEALVRRQHEVLVIAASDLEQPYRMQEGKLTVLRMRSYPNPARVGQRFLLWPEVEIRAALRDFSPHVLHLHEPLQLALNALAYSARTGTPCLLTIHALPTLVSTHFPEVPGLQRLVENCLWDYGAWLARRFDALVTPTGTTARCVHARTGLSPHVISGGVDLQKFSADPLPPAAMMDLRASLGIPPGVPVVLHVGRLDAGKNAGVVVRAAAAVMQMPDSPAAHLLIVGDGLEKRALIHLCQDLGIAARSHFPGYVSDPGRLAAIYRMADVFLMASGIETQGLVLLEAAACGLPIVAVNSAAIPEIVTDGVNGFLVPPGNAAAMAGHIAEILRKPALSDRMRRASRRASLAHDFNRTVDTYETLYTSLVQDSRKSRPAKFVPGQERQHQGIRSGWASRREFR